MARPESLAISWRDDFDDFSELVWVNPLLFDPLPHAHWHKTVVWASSFCWCFVCMSAKFVICKSLWKNSFNVNTVYSSLKKKIFLVLHNHLINSNRNQYFHNLLVTHIYTRCYRFFSFSPDILSQAVYIKQVNSSTCTERKLTQLCPLITTLLPSRQE